MTDARADFEALTKEAVEVCPSCGSKVRHERIMRLGTAGCGDGWHRPLPEFHPDLGVLWGA